MIDANVLENGRFNSVFVLSKNIKIVSNVNSSLYGGK